MKGYFKINVDWSGSYPAMCSGVWKIKINDVLIPLSDNYHFNTYNTYIEMGLSGNDEYINVYEDGLECEEWIEYIKYGDDTNKLYKALKDTLQLSEFDLELLLKKLYYEIKENDWRHGSCGGCI